MELTNPKVISYLLKKHQLRLSKSLGQHFLIDSEVPEKMAHQCGTDKDTDILEVGPGIGCLTQELLHLSHSVTSVELDKSLLPVLSELFADADHFHLIHDDIMKTDLSALFESFSAPKRGVCANLPYYITTPVVTRLFEYKQHLDFICVMVQKEVAKRFCASPGSKDYGAITLFCNFHASCEYLFDIPKESFFPAPKVDSAVILFKTLKFAPVSPKNADNMFKVIKAAFSQRRKTFKNALQSTFPFLSSDLIVSSLFLLNKNEKTRGEELNLAEFSFLSDCFFS